MKKNHKNRKSKENSEIDGDKKFLSPRELDPTDQKSKKYTVDQLLDKVKIECN